MSRGMIDHTQTTTAIPAILEFVAVAAVGILLGCALFWILYRHGALLMPNPEAAVLMFSP